VPGDTDAATIDVELRRVVTRLETTPVARITEDVISLVHTAASDIVGHTPDPDRPGDAALPLVGPTALASQLTIVVQDYWNMRTAASEDAAVAEILIDLRRSLP
jgi:hypothetical protein